jgi:ferric-dicitrate binding protein FerR (iron transport regulator)
MEKFAGDYENLSFRASYLISGFINKNLSVEEEKELDRWILASEKNMQLFEDLTDEKKMEGFLKWCTSRDVEARLKSTKQRIRFKKPSKVIAFLQIAAAAIIIGAFAFAAYWMFTPTEQKNNKNTAVAKTDIQPGSEFAMLRMSDGRMITLKNQDTVIDGNIVVKDGLVSYLESEAKVSQHEIIIPRKAFYKLQLPDGTMVWLNAESSISYPSIFEGDTRKVEVKGETYFEVVKDAKPFIVEVNGISVEAIGTAFNINAYANEKEMKTTLVEGSIKVSDDLHQQVLRPGQQIRISSAEWKKIEQVQTGAILAWKNNQFKLHDASIEEVMRQIERWYDVSVEMKDKINFHFNGTIDRNVPVSQLLQLLEKTGHVHFKIEDNKIIVTK